MLLPLNVLKLAEKLETMTLARQWRQAYLLEQYDIQMHVMAQVVTDWDLASDPTQLASWLELEPSAFAEAAEQFEMAMAAAISETLTGEPIKVELKLDLSEWQKSMKKLAAWNSAVRNNSYSDAMMLCAEVITKWNLKPSCKDAESYDQLSPKEFSAVMIEVGKAVKDIFRKSK